MRLAEFGMVHGRFQPFHNEHLDYVLRGLARSTTLVVGVTNPEPSERIPESTSAHRHIAESNPFTFFQRTQMITQCLIDCGINLSKISIVPFHLFRPDLWLNYLPKPESTTQYVRIFSEWEEKKIQLFESHGFRVTVLDRNVPKNIEATQVRKLLDEEGDWRSLVPSGTARVIQLIEEGRL